MSVYAKDIDPKCANCQHGRAIPGTLDVACELRGIVDYNYHCKKYKYDIFTKKIHRKKRINSGFTAADFSID